MSPVAMEMPEVIDFTGLDYRKIEQQWGSNIDRYHIQFYNNWGTLNFQGISKIVNAGFAVEKLVGSVSYQHRERWRVIAT